MPDKCSLRRVQYVQSSIIITNSKPEVDWKEGKKKRKKHHQQ